MNMVICQSCAVSWMCGAALSGARGSIAVLARLIAGLMYTIALCYAPERWIGSAPVVRHGPQGVGAGARLPDALIDGSAGRIRTYDQPVNSRLLYR
jgi:hypothetical protein